MNLKNKILILKDGTKGRVINHDKYVYLLVNYFKLNFNKLCAFCNILLRIK